MASRRLQHMFGTEFWRTQCPQEHVPYDYTEEDATQSASRLLFISGRMKDHALLCAKCLDRSVALRTWLQAHGNPSPRGQCLTQREGQSRSVSGTNGNHHAGRKSGSAGRASCNSGIPTVAAMRVLSVCCVAPRTDASQVSVVVS